MYVIAKPVNPLAAGDGWEVLTSFSFKGGQFGTLPVTDISVQFLPVSSIPCYVDDLPGALFFEYKEQAYSLLVALGLAGEEILRFSVLNVDL